MHFFSYNYKNVVLAYAKKRRHILRKVWIKPLSTLFCVGRECGQKFIGRTFAHTTKHVGRKAFLPTQLTSAKKPFCPRNNIRRQKCISANTTTSISKTRYTSADSVFCQHTRERGQKFHFIPRTKHPHNSIIANTYDVLPCISGNTRKRR